MSRFLAPKLQSGTTSKSQEVTVGALNSYSDVPGTLTNSRMPASSASTTALARPPLHPHSGLTTPQISTIRKDPLRGAVDNIQACASDKDDKPSKESENTLEEETPQEPLEDSTEEDLSEEQLRKLFEDEEIERFLMHFTAHVHEVRLPMTSTPVAKARAADPQSVMTVSGNKQDIVISPTAEDFPVSPSSISQSGDDERGTEDSAWTVVDRSYLRSAEDGAGGTPREPSSQSSLSLAEGIAKKYLLPNLPPSEPNPDYRFTIGRARLQVERFNLVTQPAYGPTFARMWGYASWKDRRSSAWYCTIFWILWFLDLLLPTLFAIILYTLFRRRIFSYPTLKELRDRRREAARAEALGEEVEQRFATGPEFGMRDAWRLFRSVTKGQKRGQSKKGKSKKTETAAKQENVSEVQLDATEGDEPPVKINAQEESQAEKDTKRAILQAMSEISDLHERVKNIFLWRRPEVSKKYAVAIALLLLVTLFLPARYLAKSVYFVGGFFFWFVPPVILGLPPQERARIPPAFADSPTDAQYAMELIAMRVARGESVVAKSAKNKKKNSGAANENANALSQDEVRENGQKDIDWRKWGERAARGFAWAEEGKRVFKGEMPLTWPPTNPLVPPVVFAHGQPNAELETSTYPAQHITSPGLITLTSTAFCFTQVLSSRPKIQIPLDQIRGVKKSGKMGGLTLKWGETADDEREERFRWIGARDEVFAKLVGWRGRRWAQV